MPYYLAIQNIVRTFANNKEERRIRVKEKQYTTEQEQIARFAKATVSQHLKELKEAGLIQGEIETPKVRYCINRENWELARKLFAAFLGDCKCKDTSCCE